MNGKIAFFDKFFSAKRYIFKAFEKGLMELLPLFIVVLGAIFTVYTAYWGGVLIIGGYTLWKRWKDTSDEYRRQDMKSLPKISLIVPVKNEAKVIGRLIEGFRRVRYPRDKLELIFVEDGSTDGTYELLLKYKELDPRIRVIHLKENKEGKPRALNEGIKYATGELLALMDADCVPEPDLFLKAAYEYRKGRKVLVGHYKVINAGESFLTRLSVFEEFLWRFMSIGRMRLGLSVPLTGSFSFVDRELVLKAGGWRPSLAEDVELGVRLLKMGFKGYFLDGFVWLETPKTIHAFVKQRVRWYRGYMETALKHLDLLAKVPRKLALDNLLMLSTPFFATLTLFSYALMALSLPKIASGIFLILLVAGFIGMNLLSLLLLNIGILLIVGNEAHGLVKISPFVYVYTMLLALSSLVAFVQMALKAKPVWTKTEKSGWIDRSRLMIQGKL